MIDSTAGQPSDMVMRPLALESAVAVLGASIVPGGIAVQLEAAGGAALADLRREIMENRSIEREYRALHRILGESDWPAMPDAELPRDALARLRHPYDVVSFWGLDYLASEAMRVFHMNADGRDPQLAQRAATAAIAAQTLCSLLGALLGGVRYRPSWSPHVDAKSLRKAWRSFEISWAGFRPLWTVCVVPQQSDKDPGKPVGHGLRLIDTHEGSAA